MNELIPKCEQRNILFYAFRYTLGRSTFAPHTVMDVIRQAMPSLPISDKKQYIREIKEAVERDDAGMYCDRKEWVRLAKDLEDNCTAVENQNTGSC